MNLKNFVIYGIGKLIPDEVWIRSVYRKKMGKKLDLDNPKTFNEKLQWMKLHCRKPEYTEMVDKLKAKEYVSSMIGGGISYPLLAYGIMPMI